MFDLDLQLKKILIKLPLLKSYIDWLKFVPTYDVNTGSTNGKIVFYNPINLSERTEVEQQFTLVHEIMHVALDHMERRGDRDPLGFNYACDAVINQMIQDCGIPISEGSINCPEAKDYSVEDYYDLIRSRDDYDDILAPYLDDSDKEEILSKHDDWTKYTLDIDGKTSDKPKDVPRDEKSFANENKKIKERKKDEFFSDIEKGFSLSGYDEADYKLSDVGSATGFLNWQDLLKYEITKNKDDYDFFNGEFDENGIWYYPYQRINEEDSEVEILIDTSYSVDVKLVKAFLREVKSIVGKAKIKIACFNTKVDEFVEIKDENDIDNFVITSYGGTNFEEAVKGFKSPTSTKIVFTDGFAENPTSFCEAIWVVYSDKKINPPGGFVYNIDPMEYENKENRNVR